MVMILFPPVTKHSRLDVPKSMRAPQTTADRVRASLLLCPDVAASSFVERDVH